MDLLIKKLKKRTNCQNWIDPLDTTNYPEVTDGDCISDSIYNRVLCCGERRLNDLSMSVDNCRNFCGNYTYFGVENGKECFCDNTVRYYNLKYQTDCNMQCSGDQTEICGGKDRLNIYHTVPNAKK